MLHFLGIIREYEKNEIYRFLDYDSKSLLDMHKEEVVQRLKNGETLRNIGLNDGLNDGIKGVYGSALGIVRVERSGEVKVSYDYSESKFITRKMAEKNEGEYDSFNKALKAVNTVIHMAHRKSEICNMLGEIQKISTFDLERRRIEFRISNISNIGFGKECQPWDYIEVTNPTALAVNERLEILEKNYRITHEGVLEILDSNITNLNITKGIDRIYGNGCAELRRLERLKVGKQVKIIGPEAFRFCRSLVNIELLDGLEHICEGAFRDVGSNNSIIIPSTVTKLSNRVFFNTYIGKIYIPDSVEKLGDEILGGADRNRHIKIMTSKRISNHLISTHRLGTFKYSEFICIDK